jgi:carbonic anhydrase
MKTVLKLLENNREWVHARLADDPAFFSRLKDQQTPQFLWIGCSDSRVPANEITGLAPGEVFVHRNIANVVVHTDLNCLSVLQFAVEVLKVRHIIVCGHYGCSGVQAALAGTRLGLVDNWLRHVQDVADQHGAYLGRLATEQRAPALAELNVIDQVRNVCRTSVVQDAWARGETLFVNGWIYGVHDGTLRDLDVTISGSAQLQPRLDAALAAYRPPQQRSAAV